MKKYLVGRTMITVTCAGCGLDKEILKAEHTRRLKVIGKHGFYHKDCYLANTQWNKRRQLLERKL